MKRVKFVKTGKYIHPNQRDVVEVRDVDAVFVVPDEFASFHPGSLTVLGEESAEESEGEPEGGGEVEQPRRRGRRRQAEGTDPAE